MPLSAGRVRRHPVRTWTLILSLGLALVGSPGSGISLGMHGAGAKRPRVFVDPRLELVSIVQLIGEPRGGAGQNSSYRRDVERHFGPFRSHPAVRILRSMSAGGFDRGDLLTLTIRLSSPPDLSIREPVPDAATARAGGRGNLEAWLAALRDFAATTRFMTFLSRHQGAYSEVAADLWERVEGPVTFLDDFAGVSRQGGVVVLGMLLRDEGYSLGLEGTDGKTRSWSFISPIVVGRGLPDFGASGPDLVWHEFAHAFVDPLAEMHREEVAQSSRLLDPIREGMARQGYLEWPTVVREHVVRAITVVLIRRKRGEEAAATALHREVERCFIYLPPLVQWIEDYARRRSRYPAFSDFFPVLLNVLTSRARAHAAGRFHPACDPPRRGASPGTGKSRGEAGLVGRLPGRGEVGCENPIPGLTPCRGTELQ